MPYSVCRFAFCSCLLVSGVHHSLFDVCVCLWSLLAGCECCHYCSLLCFGGKDSEKKDEGQVVVTHCHSLSFRCFSSVTSPCSFFLFSSSSRISKEGRGIDDGRMRGNGTRTSDNERQWSDNGVTME